ncbi:hypothetical protein SAMN05421755_10681 [Nitrosomonas sp. Nm33]|nr:hypothetical protein SAMN05421755_10681 [Nitrosomonas sp. Nm33]
MKKKQFIRAFDNSTKSIAIKSTRRIFFNHLYQPIEERGHFHVDQMYGSGTGILLKHENKFYLLTAHHVINKATKFNFTNPSPFWVTSNSKYKTESIYDFLMPARIIHIGELISDRGVSIDTGDIVLIELFPPFPRHKPNHFLDLDSRRHRLLRKNEFFEGQLLLAGGFPFESNSFEFYDEPVGIFTHSTHVHRRIMDGVCEISDGEPYMTLDGISEENYMNLSGASGGIATNIKDKSNEVQMAGMLVSAGPTLIRFIPSYLIEHAIINKDQARTTLIDPAIEGRPTLEEVSSLIAHYASVI